MLNHCVLDWLVLCLITLRLPVFYPLVESIDLFTLLVKSVGETVVLYSV